MHGYGLHLRLLVAIAAVALLALESSAPSFASARIGWPGKAGAPMAHPVVQRAALVQLVSLGKGRCGDLEVFVPIIDGHRGIPMC